MIKNKSSEGVTLIELMVSLSLGMILVFSMLAFYGALTRKISVQVRNQIEVQEYRNALNLLSNSIKNAGMFKCNRSEWLFMAKDLEGGPPVLRFTVPAEKNDLRAMYDGLDYLSSGYPYHTSWTDSTFEPEFPWPVSTRFKDCTTDPLTEKVRLRNVFIGVSRSYSGYGAQNTYSAPDKLTFDSSGNAVISLDEGAGKSIGYYGVFSEGASPWFETSNSVDDPMIITTSTSKKNFIPTTAVSLTRDATVQLGLDRQIVGYPLFLFPKHGDTPKIEVFLGLAKDDGINVVPDSLITGTNESDYKQGGWVKLTNDHIDALTLGTSYPDRTHVFSVADFAYTDIFNADEFLFGYHNHKSIKPEYNRRIIAIKFNITVHPGKSNEFKLSKVVRFGTYLPTANELVEEAESS